MISAKITFSRAELEKQVKQEVVKDFDELGPKILLAIEQATPVLTGEAKRSWTVSKHKDSLLLENDEDYIAYVNNGTSRIEPRHFIERVCLSFGQLEGQVTKLK